MIRHKHLSSAALVVALLALVASLGGGSYAAKLITGKDVRNGSITGKDVKKKTLKSRHVKDRSLTGKDLKDGSVLPADLGPGTLEPSMTALRLIATQGDDADAARAAAPEHVLHRSGPLTVYVKCFTVTPAEVTHAVAYVKTSLDGALFAGDSDSSGGGGAPDYLDHDTAELDRELLHTQAGPNSSDYVASHSADFGAFAADRTAVSGLLAVGAKSGVLANGNGPYGPGDACVFSGNIRSS